MADLRVSFLATAICGGGRVFEIEMDESHRCRIVDLKAA
jgi:hypothetical protein